MSKSKLREQRMAQQWQERADARRHIPKQSIPWPADDGLEEIAIKLRGCGADLMIVDDHGRRPLTVEEIVEQRRRNREAHEARRRERQISKQLASVSGGW